MRYNIVIKYSIVVLIISLIAACKLAPKYDIPDVDIPDHYSNIKWQEAKPGDNYPRGDWWKFFNDEQLEELEEKLNKDNFNIVASAAQYREALALVEEARAGFFPTISANFNRTRQESGSSQTLSTSRAASFNASWEPDFWGATASNVEASVAAEGASKAALESARLSAQASLAQYYYEYCVTAKDDDILRKIEQAYLANLNYVKSRFQQGVADNDAILQAEILLQTATTLRINNANNLNLYKHAIAVLVGSQPSTFKLKTCTRIPNSQMIPTGIPSTLLERRPDVAEAERTLAQSNAEIGIARAAYFPAFNLSLSKTLQGIGNGNLLSLPLSAWSFGFGVSQAVFSGGAQIAATRVAEERYNSDLALYKEAVLGAFQDVEDSLATLTNLIEQEKVQRQSTQNAQKSLQIVESQYKAGTVDYASLLASKIAFYNSSKASNDLEGLRIVAEISLIKSLGGMWHLGEDKR